MPRPLRFRSQALSTSQRFASRFEFHGLVACRSRFGLPPCLASVPHDDSDRRSGRLDAEPTFTRVGSLPRREPRLALEPSPRVRRPRGGLPPREARSLARSPFPRELLPCPRIDEDPVGDEPPKSPATPLFHCAPASTCDLVTLGPCRLWLMDSPERWTAVSDCPAHLRGGAPPAGASRRPILACLTGTEIGRAHV